MKTAKIKLICECEGELEKIARTRFSEEMMCGTIFYQCKGCGQLYDYMCGPNYGLHVYEYDGKLTAEELKKKARNFRGMIPPEEQ